MSAFEIILSVLYAVWMIVWSVFTFISNKNYTKLLTSLKAELEWKNSKSMINYNLLVDNLAKQFQLLSKLNFSMFELVPPVENSHFIHIRDMVENDKIAYFNKLENKANDDLANSLSFFASCEIFIPEDIANKIKIYNALCIRQIQFYEPNMRYYYKLDISNKEKELVAKYKKDYEKPHILTDEIQENYDSLLKFTRDYFKS